MVMRPDFMKYKQDGIDHINIYSKGATKLGRLLTNFAHTPFKYLGEEFQSVEGFWYWYLTDKKHNHLKSLHGFAAKSEGKKYRNDKNDVFLTVDDKNIILEAIRCKLRQNIEIVELLKNSTLPLTHYYKFGDTIVELPQYQWIVDELERIRSLLRVRP